MRVGHFHIDTADQHRRIRRPGGRPALLRSSGDLEDSCALGPDRGDEMAIVSWPCWIGHGANRLDPAVWRSDTNIDCGIWNRLEARVPDDDAERNIGAGGRAGRDGQLHRIAGGQCEPSQRLLPERVERTVRGRHEHAPSPRCFAGKSHRAAFAESLHGDQRPRTAAWAARDREDAGAWPRSADRRYCSQRRHGFPPLARLVSGRRQLHDRVCLACRGQRDAVHATDCRRRQHVAAAIGEIERQDVLDGRAAEALPRERARAEDQQSAPALADEAAREVELGFRELVALDVCKDQRIVAKESLPIRGIPFGELLAA